MGHSTGSSGHSELGHIVPLKVYRTVLVILLVLTIITVAIAQFDFGNMNLVVAMVVASVKAALVALFFMHLKYENPITWLYAAIPIFLLGLLLGGVFIDDPFRISPEDAVVAAAPAKNIADDHGHH
jgi:cytochrome c oxidase subunit 4